MNEVTRQIQRVQKAVASRTITKAELARRAGIRRSVLTDMEASDWLPRSATLIRLVDVIDQLGFPRRPRAAGNDRAAA